jgi:FkbM family methyltransferase
MRLNLEDWLGRHVFVTGEYEPPTSAVLKALLRPGDVFVDVGANVGYFSLLAARRVGPTGQVVAFEPVALTRGQLAENVQLNRLGSVTVRGEALSDQAGEVEFFVGPTDHRGTSSLRPLAASSERIRVRTVRLDDLELPGPVRVVKIDVEGAELLALRGMADTLRQDHPDLIVEVTDSFLRTMGHSVNALCEFVGGLGYRMYVIDHNGLKPLDPLRGDFPGQFNALFTHRPELSSDLSPSGCG